MEYNSQKQYLIMPEYGRHVQDMIRNANTIENDQERQAYIEKVIELMHSMNPQSRNIEDSKSKLWKHVFRIAEYDLNVQPPSMEKPTAETDQKVPKPVPYPDSKARFRHYGNHVQCLINKAVDMEDGPVKDGFAVAIASYMKLAYKTWNREHFVSDDVIIDDLETLSDGQLDLHDGANISRLSKKAQSKRGLENINKSPKTRRKNNRNRRRRRK